MEDDIKRWTAKRNAALVMENLFNWKKFYFSNLWF